MKKEKSKVHKIFDAFVNGNWHTMNYTREKASSAWGDFWFLLISSGFAFEKTDLITIKKTCSCCTGSNYDPTWYGVGEGHYSLAVRCGNLTFAYACEALWKRTPFIGFGFDYYDCHPDFSNHATQSKSAGRLVLNSGFTWKGEIVKVTSFKDEDHSIIACAYHPDTKGYRPSKVKKRFTISAKDFRQEMSNRRKPKEQ